MQHCDTVVKGPLPCESYGTLEKFNISGSKFGTVSMRRRMRA